VGFFTKRTTIQYMHDCSKCQGQGTVTVTVDPKDAPAAKNGYKGQPFQVRQTCDKCKGTGNTR
jgi:DnaJ-class molecular chaperone